MAKGEDDPRAKSFLYLIGTVLPDLIARNKHPSRLLVENVAGFEVRLHHPLSFFLKRIFTFGKERLF